MREARGGAPTALVFTFVIEPLVIGTDPFLMAELRDAQVNGASYAGLNQKDFGSRIEPHTAVFGVRQGHRAGQSLPASTGVDGTSRATVMRTFLRGTKLPRSGQVSVTIDVGWGRTDEHFTLQVPVPPPSSGSTWMFDAPKPR